MMPVQARFVPDDRSDPVQNLEKKYANISRWQKPHVENHLLVADEIDRPKSDPDTVERLVDVIDDLLSMKLSQVQALNRGTIIAFIINFVVIWPSLPELMARIGPISRIASGVFTFALGILSWYVLAQIIAFGVYVLVYGPEAEAVLLDLNNRYEGRPETLRDDLRLLAHHDKSKLTLAASTLQRLFPKTPTA